MQAEESLPPSTPSGQRLPFEFHETDNTITARRQQWSQPPNMAIDPLRPGYLRIDRQTTASLQFQLGTQTNTITLKQVATLAVRSSNIETTACGVQNTMLWMSQVWKNTKTPSDDKMRKPFSPCTVSQPAIPSTGTVLQSLERERLNKIPSLSKPGIQPPAVYFNIILVPYHYFIFAEKTHILILWLMYPVTISRTYTDVISGVRAILSTPTLFPPNVFYGKDVSSKKILTHASYDGRAATI